MNCCRMSTGQNLSTEENKDAMFSSQEDSPNILESVKQVQESVRRLTASVEEMRAEPHTETKEVNDANLSLSQEGTSQRITLTVASRMARGPSTRRYNSSFITES